MFQAGSYTEMLGIMGTEGGRYTGIGGRVTSSVRCYVDTSGVEGAGQSK